MSKKDMHYEKFIQGRMDGKSFNYLSKEIGVSKQTLINWSKEGEVKDSIRIARNCRIQATLHELKLNEECQVVYFSNLYKQIQDEVAKRDLAEVPTEKLVQLMEKVGMRLDNSLNSEIFEDEEPLGQLYGVKCFHFNPKH